MGMRCLRAESNAQDGTNGGYPLAIDILANGSFPRFSSKTAGDNFFLWCKGFWWADSNTDLIQQAAYSLYDLQDTTFGNQIWNIVPLDGPAGLRATWADVEPNLSTLRRYGVGRLTTAANIGDTALTVDVKNSILATGDERIFRADGSAVTDNLIIDKRSAPGIIDWAQMEEIVASNAVPNGSTVPTTLASPLVNAYPIGTKVRSLPDKIDLVPSLTDVVMTNAGSTIFASASVVLYPASTWVDEIEIEMLAPNGDYKITSARYGVAGGASPITYNKATTASPSWPAIGVSGPQFLIPAGTIAGINAAGDKITFRTNASMMACFFLLHHPANAGLKTHTQIINSIYEV